MKTPEEIKKGLECCSKLKTNCGLCPYRPQNDGNCMNALVPDSIALIQQLERERDMAVDDIECGICCETCAHYDTPSSDQPCATCNKGWDKHSNWQWRGVQEVE